MTVYEYDYMCLDLNKKTEDLYYNASNYSLNINQVKGGQVSIFNALDNNSDGNLSQNELATFVSEIENLKSKSSSWVSASKDEWKDFWNKFLPNVRFNKKDLFGFIQVIQNNYKNTIETVSDGVIDHFKQGNRNDCWLLTEANNLSKTTWGSEIIKESINYNEDNEEYSVNLKGVNFVAKITKDEVEYARESGKYSTGDIDVLLLELAAEKYFAQEVEAERMLRDKDLLNMGIGSGTMSLSYLLTGNYGKTFLVDPQKTKKVDSQNTKNQSDHQIEPWIMALDETVVNHAVISKEELQNILKNIIENKDDYAINVIYKSPDEWNNQELEKKDGENLFANIEHHIFALTELEILDDGNMILTLENPGATCVTIKKTLEEFLTQVAQVSIVSKNDEYDNL